MTVEASYIEELLEEYNFRRNRLKFQTMFEDKEKYPKHHLFFEKGAEYSQRLNLGANRTGKTLSALCEVTMHITGLYPSWWKGKRFNRPQNWWLVGVDSKLILASMQPMLIGPAGNFGSGLIPKDLIDFESMKETTKATTGIGTFRVMHSSGAYSSVEFKSAASGRKAFQGTERCVLIDEECDAEVYGECLLRTMTNDQLMMLTFTPLMGLTPLILNYYGGEYIGGDGEVAPGRFAMNTTWDDAPHLTEKARAELYASLPPHQREARSKGIPSLGAGLIYPVPESVFVIEPFEIPKHYLRMFGMDVGWKRTAAIWGAIDPETRNVYCYAEHYVSEAEPSIHAASIRAKGEWIPGVIDSAANGRSQIDGDNLMSLYKSLGLDIQNADKAVEAGIYQVWEMLSQGRLKIFSSCIETLKEIRLYRRDEKGRIVKSGDHLMDCLRYLILKRDVAKCDIKPTFITPTVSQQYRRR